MNPIEEKNNASYQWALNNVVINSPIGRDDGMGMIFGYMDTKHSKTRTHLDAIFGANTTEFN